MDAHETTEIEFFTAVDPQTGTPRAIVREDGLRQIRELVGMRAACGWIAERLVSPPVVWYEGDPGEAGGVAYDVTDALPGGWDDWLGLFNSTGAQLDENGGLLS